METILFILLTAVNPYISRVFEYRPAPGQFINTLPAYEEGDTDETMAQKAEECPSIFSAFFACFYINIEDISMQTEALTAYTDEYADYTIKDLIDDIDDIDGFAEDFGDLFDKWAKGDGEIASETEEDIAEIPEDLLDDHDAYNKALLENRNQDMADKASEYIKAGKNCLFMVGAAHYSGDNGVDNLLEKMGFTPEKVLSL